MNLTLDNHPWKIFAGTRQEWELFDTKERFLRNIKNNKDLIKINGWLENKITYEFNSAGFRSEEFLHDVNSIMFLGCSLTFGTGLPLEDIYAYRISKLLNMRYYNLALGASSNDTAFRLAYYYIPKLLPKIVFCLSPDPSRFELWDENDIHFFRLLSGADKQKDFYIKWLKHENNSFLNHKKNILAIENLCISNKIKFITYNSFEIFSKDKWIKDDYARDLQHPGKMTHLSVYESLKLNL